jgi:hypothetical protein
MTEQDKIFMDVLAIEVLRHNLKSLEYSPNDDGDASNFIIATDTYDLVDAMMAERIRRYALEQSK